MYVYLYHMMLLHAPGKLVHAFTIHSEIIILTEPGKLQLTA